MFDRVLKLGAHNRFMPDYVMTTVVVAKLPRHLEPIFAAMVGTSGCGKSEMINAVKMIDTLCHRFDSASTKAIISGWQDDKDPDKDYSLASKIDGKTLVTDDMLTLLSSDPKVATEILGQLHSGHKGMMNKDLGTGNKSYTLRFSTLFAATPAIDIKFMQMQEGGPRWIKLWFNTPSSYNYEHCDNALRAHADTGRRWVQLKEVIESVVLDRIRNLPDPANLLEPNNFDEIRQFLSRIATFSGAARSLPADKLFKRWKPVIYESPEVGSRLGKQLHTMGSLRCWLDDRHEWNEEDFSFCKKIAWDTIPRISQRVLRALWKYPGGLSTQELARRSHAENVDVPTIMTAYSFSGLVVARGTVWVLDERARELINTFWSNESWWHHPNLKNPPLKNSVQVPSAIPNAIKPDMT